MLAQNVTKLTFTTAQHRFDVQHFIVCKASILFNRTVYKRAMPQSPAAAIVWFQTAKNKNTKQSNQRTNMDKTVFCGVEFIVCMTVEARTT